MLVLSVAILAGILWIASVKYTTFAGQQVQAIYMRDSIMNADIIRMEKNIESVRVRAVAMKDSIRAIKDNRNGCDCICHGSEASGGVNSTAIKITIKR